MSITSKMLNKIDVDVQNLKGSLQPENLGYWYKKITAETVEILPPWLTDKINIKQDPILPLKFNINISKRAVRYFMQVIDYNLQKMPYTTQLYFMKVQETVSTSMDKALVWITLLQFWLNFLLFQSVLFSAFFPLLIEWNL